MFSWREGMIVLGIDPGYALMGWVWGKQTAAR